MLKHITLAALASVAYAQTQGLNATLSSIPELSNLTGYFVDLPDSLAALEQARNITLLAPSNRAFSDLLTGPLGAQLTANPELVQAMLTYHVLNGTYGSGQVNDDTQIVATLLTDPVYTNVTGGQRVEVEEEDDNIVFISGLLNNLTVARTDINFTGGVIHIVDTVLTLPSNISTTALAADLTALVGALANASLADTLDTTPDVTVFAPVNAGFAAVGSVLANASTDDLTDLLGYHVVNGTVLYSTDLQGNQTVTALNGGELTIRVLDDGDLFVNGARVVVRDVLVANGVVHLIDNVLNPSNSTAAPSETEDDDDDDSGDVQFTSASSATNVPFTSGVTATTTIGGGGGGSATATATGGEASASASGAAAIKGVSGGLVGAVVGVVVMGL